MDVKKIVKIVVSSILMTICFLSLFLGLFYTYLLDIEKVILKEGDFDFINKTYKFDFKGPTNDIYGIFLKFYRHEDIIFDGLSEGKIKYSINIELKDEENNILKNETIDQTSLISGRAAQDYFEWRIFSFNAVRGKKYNARITFKSGDVRFNNVKKEIYIEEDYDRAAPPWWMLLQYTFFSIFIITFIPTLIMGFIYIKKKRKKMDNA